MISASLICTLLFSPQAAQDLEERLTKLDKLRANIVKMEKSGIRPSESVRQIYWKQLGKIFLERLGKLLPATLKNRKDLLKRTADHYEQLHRLNYAYQVLSGRDLPEDPREKNMVRWVLQFRCNFPDQSLWLESIMGGRKASTRTKVLADTQLRYFLKKWDRGKDYFGRKFNVVLVSDVNDLLTRSFWVDATYRMIKKASFQQKSLKPLTLSQLVGRALGKKFLNLKRAKTVPGGFTQAGYDGYFKRHIQAKSREMAGRFETMGVDKTWKEIAEKMNARYRDDYAQYWNDFGKSIRVRRLSSLVEAKECLESFSVKGNSALGELFKGIWKLRKIQIGDNTYNDPDDELEWLSDSLGSYEGVANALGDFADLGYSFRKYVDRDQLPALDEAFRNGRKKLDKSVRGIRARKRLKEIAVLILNQPADQVLEALQREARNQMNALWKESVLTPFNKQMAGRYPFVRDPRKKDANIVKFGELFGFIKKREVVPGKFWETCKYVEVLSTATIRGRELLNLTSEFEKAVKTAKQFRDVLFSGEGLEKTKVRIKFDIRFSSARGIIKIGLRVQDREFDIRNRPGLRMRNLTWIQGNSTYLTVTYQRSPTAQRKVRTLYTEKPGHQWTLLRLVDSGEATAETRTRFKLRWKYAGGMMQDAWIDAKGARNPFGKNFFAAFHCPEKIARE